MTHYFDTHQLNFRNLYDMKINSSTVVKGGLLYVAGTSAAYMFLRQRQKHGEGIEDDAKGVIWDDGHSLNTFKRISTEYDAKINMDEMVMGIRWLRWVSLQKKILCKTCLIDG